MSTALIDTTLIPAGTLACYEVSVALFSGYYLNITVAEISQAAAIDAVHKQLASMYVKATGEALSLGQYDKEDTTARQVIITYAQADFAPAPATPPEPDDTPHDPDVARFDDDGGPHVAEPHEEPWPPIPAGIEDVPLSSLAG